VDFRDSAEPLCRRSGANVNCGEREFSRMNANVAASRGAVARDLPIAGYSSLSDIMVID